MRGKKFSVVSWVNVSVPASVEADQKPLILWEEKPERNSWFICIDFARLLFCGLIKHPNSALYWRPKASAILFHAQCNSSADKNWEVDFDL